ncbi:MAG: phosphatidylglycerophosphatase A [Zetaproteobacteria bacterium]|nr:MAG: phosphatidylglycerophosphatase A [Zetaproteobacteria bacterium]
MDAAFVWIAAGFGSGRLPYAPGTWGSLVAWLMALPVFLAGAGWWLAAMACVALVLGMVAVARIVPAGDDPPWVVIDEWAGVWAALALVVWVSPTLWAALATLVVFRVLDITKPWPIARLERMSPGWMAVMLDDWAAGLMSGVVVALAFGGVA